MEEFFTSDKAAEGVRVPLTQPNGEPSSHWLHIIGIDSDAYKRADADSRRKLIEAAKIEDNDKRWEFGQDLERELIATLITSWSFEQECTMANKKEFLKKAPQIADMVNRLSANRQYFFKKGSTNSTNGQNESST